MMYIEMKSIVNGFVGQIGERDSLSALYFFEIF